MGSSGKRVVLKARIPPQSDSATQGKITQSQAQNKEQTVETLVLVKWPSDLPQIS